MSPTPCSATDQHRKKRPFQPAITSYFHAARHIADSSSDDDDYDDDSDINAYYRDAARLHSIPKPNAPRPTLAPTLPDAVQSSLLSVGMRVRKSVPEGYKTPKTLGLSTSTTTSTSTHSLAPLRKPHSAYRDPASETLHIPVDALAATLQHQRELLPFCGLNKIGGYAEQPTTTTTSLFPTANSSSFPLPAHAFSLPFSSQDSGYGTSVPRQAGKRGWSEESDGRGARTAAAREGLGTEQMGVASRSNDFLFSIPARLSAEDDIPVSPLSESPPPSLPLLRSYAQPKSRRRADRREAQVHDQAQSVAQGRLAVGHASDFEEADFLDTNMDGMDVDMDMGVDRMGV